MGFTQGLSGSIMDYKLAIVCVILFAAFHLYSKLPQRPPFPKNAPKLASDSWPILGSLSFFTKRWDFCQQAIRQSKSGNFSFYVGNYRVVALSGEEQRKLFFENHGLAFSEGYATLLAGAPQVKENNNAFNKDNSGNTGFSQWYKKRLVRVLSGQQLKNLLPQILKDVRSNLDAVAAKPSGITDPFDSIYRTVFQITVRTVGCNEIANDDDLREKFLGLFETIESAATPLSIMFPWLPLPAKVSKLYSGAQLYRIVKKVIDERKRLGRREDDALQYLMDQGDSMLNIISFVMGALFAGQLNSGVNIAYVLCYLAQEQDWLDRVREEVNEIADRYCSDRSLSLKDRLMHVPIDAWITEFPTIDLCLKETIRLHMSGNAFRLNMSGTDIPIGKAGTEVIPNGAFVTIPAGEMHYNPEIYTNGDEWDPARYLPGREEDKNQTYAWMGWGHGAHQCLGMRLAKLETNSIVALFLAYFDDPQLCDKNGRSMEKVPPCNRNNHAPRKPDQTICLKVKRAQVDAV